ncbi:SAM-dependent methyltransferase [Streptomyces sp. DT24]|uniref:SAM-dependent methyltransferase n=1 Tax=unclassified Streptomyces TaxID=2593676 RepID=UPI0023B8DC52|nr:class I SAM-dependent methyltransferase [Streptomyces sp. AM 4-1-1]WEH35115.1 class I SAM-dependent methyltransferase [Streptomyces sp. AM 4-1-1]
MNADAAFNGFISTNVVFALERLDLFARLDEAKSLNITDFCVQNGLDESVFRALVSSAESFGYLSVRADQVALTQDGRDVRRMIGFFTWGVGGYHDVFANAAPIARGKRSFGDDVRRDEAMVALGSAQADIALMRHLLDEQIAQLDFSVLADLGSGISERLCRLVQARPGTRGIGLDISQSATELAAETVSRYSLHDQVKPVCADVLDVISGKQRIEGAEEVDVVMSFMFLHDLLVDPATRSEIIPSLRAAFPKAHTFLLGDTTVRPNDGSGTLPIFSSGFELAHALMGVPIYTRQTYEDLFEKGGMTVRRTVPFGAPHTYLFVLEAR